LKINEEVNNGKINSRILLADSVGQTRYLFANEVEVGDDYFRIMFLPDGLVLDGRSWAVAADNFLEKRKDKILARHFAFSNESQSIGIIDSLYEHKYIISNFGIQNIFNIVKSEKYDYVVRGNVDGEIIFPNINSPKSLMLILPFGT